MAAAAAAATTTTTAARSATDEHEHVNIMGSITASAAGSNVLRENESVRGQQLRSEGQKTMGEDR